MLKVEYLRAKVGGFEVTVPRLEVVPGRIACLVGRSGSGKTTVLNTIAGFLKPLQGTVSFGGRDLTGLPPEKRKAAMVFQRGALFPHLTVSENVEYGLAVQGMGKAARAAEAGQWLAKLEIEELAGRRPNEISVGQAQRVGIARALAVRFPILLLDEPFASLDPATRGHLRRTVAGLVKEEKLAVVLVSHYLEDLKELADEAICLSAGKVLWAADPKSLNLDDPKLAEALFGH